MTKRAFLGGLFLVLFVVGAQRVSFAEGVSDSSLINVTHLGQMAILHDGRIKPIDSFARHFLLQLSGRSSYEGQSALEWVSRLMLDPESVRDDRVFLINHPETAEAATVSSEGRRYFSFSELIEGFSELEGMASYLDETVEPKDFTLVEREIIRVTNNMFLYMNTAQAFLAFHVSDEFKVTSPETKALLRLKENQECCSYADIVLRAPLMSDVVARLDKVDANHWTDMERDVFRLINHVYELKSMNQSDVLKILPVIEGNTIDWLTPIEASGNKQAQQSESLQNEMLYLVDLVRAWKNNNQDSFDRAAVSFNFSLKKRLSEVRELKTLPLELFYNDIRPFFYAKIVYLISLLLLIAGAVMRRLSRFIVIQCLIIAGLSLQTFGIIARIIILNRPPVSNLFETFLFVGWITVLTGLCLSRVKNLKVVGLTIASFTGVSLLFISGKFAAEGDTMKMLVAVLNSNFWLSTHVITITIGYAGCCLAGMVGHIYLFQKILNRSSDKLAATYRILLLTLGWGLSFAFLGTILGGVWADQSWGRFWGWDPKENGALMIVLWSAMAFHARLAGLVRESGLAVLAALGMVVVMWAWFGVNLLSVGLHSYGFTQGAAFNLILFVSVELLLLLVLMWRINRMSRLQPK